MSDALAKAQTISGNIPATDLSKQFLDSFFGPNWNTVLKSTVEEGSAVSIIFTLLAQINTIAMTIASVMLVLYTMYGIIGTAHEGKPLGQKFHTIWAPVRSAIAISFLSPIIQGLCILQVLILLSIGMSVNFANGLWTGGLDYINKNEGKLTTLMPVDTRSNIEIVVDHMLYTSAVQQYMIYYQDKAIVDKAKSFYNVDWVVDEKYSLDPKDYIDNKTPKTADGTITSGKWVISFNLPQYPVKSGSDLSLWEKAKNKIAKAYRDAKEVFTGNGQGDLDASDLGAIIIPGVSKTDPVALARKDACTNTFNAIGTLVYKRVAAMSEQKDLSKTGSRTDVIKAIDTYIGSVEPKIAKVSDTTDADYKKTLEAFVTDAKSSGWAFAGSYYWTLSRYAERQSEITKNKPQFQRPRKEDIGQFFNNNSEFIGVIDHVTGSFGSGSFDILDKAQLAKSGAEMNPETQVKRELERSYGNDVLAFFVHKMAAEGDIIGNLADLGHHSIHSALGMVLSQGMLRGAAGGAHGAVGGVPVIGAVTGFVKSLTDHITTWTSVLIVPLLILGVFLAYYLPALPWIAWSLAIVGWVILCIESVVAAPLWAVAHAIPEGEGIAGQHGRQGYMLFLGILLRPPLMVVGFFFALVLTGIVGKFMAVSYLVFDAGMNAEHPDLITSIVMIFIFGTTCIVVTHKVFKLITHLPDTVTRWLGQQFQNLGEEQDEQRIRGAVSNATTTATSAVASGLSSAGTRPSFSGGGRGGGYASGQTSGRGGKPGGSSSADGSKAESSTADDQHTPGETGGKGLEKDGDF